MDQYPVSVTEALLKEITHKIVLAEGEPPLPDQVGFFCQQSAEKYLKAFLLAWGQVPPRTHGVDVLVELSDRG